MRKDSCSLAWTHLKLPGFVPTLKPFKEEQVMGNIQKIRKIYHAAVYVRLSKDDDMTNRRKAK